MNKIKIPFAAESNGAFPIKALHGVNCGPVSYSGLLDQTSFYKEAGFPLIRLHDTNWPHPREVDYYTIFPDFSKDASDPSSYHFATTDRYIRECVNTGADIIFRLGVSIEHSEDKFHVYPPKDLDKFADICLGIVHHYTEGWADGFVCKNIKYWEIWNEPDLISGFGRTHLPSPTWIGSFEDFAELYKKVALRLKQYNPALSVGGPGFAHLDNPFCLQLLQYIASNKLPLDFCSWHCYTWDTTKPRRQAKWLRETLDCLGYKHTESHLNEWCYVPKDSNFGKMFAPSQENYRTIIHGILQGEQGAAYSAAFLIALQQAPVEEAAFFCASPLNTLSLFNMYGYPQKVFYAFKHFNFLSGMKLGSHIQVPDSGTGLFTLSCFDNIGRNHGILLVNYMGEAGTYKLELDMPGPVPPTMRIFRTDEACEFTEETLPFNNNFEVALSANCVISILF